MLETQHARGSFVEGQILQLGGVRSVISRDGVNESVNEGSAKGRDVSRGTKRRVHLEVCVKSLKGTFVQREVVWRDLASNAKTFTSRRHHHRHRARAREMQEVHRTAGETNKFKVAQHHEFLGERRSSYEAKSSTKCAFVHRPTVRQLLVLTVLGEANTERFGVLERPTHQ